MSSFAVSAVCVSVCTFVLVKQVNYKVLKHRNELVCCQRRLRQCLHFCTSKASKPRTANELLAQYVYFFTSKASKLRTCENVLHIQPQTLEEVDVAALVHAHLHHTSAYVSIRQQT